MNNKTKALSLFFLSTLLWLTACGGGGANSDPVEENNPPPAADTSATLSWQPSVTRENGNDLAMNEIRRYRIYQGSSANNLSLIQEITDINTRTFTVTNLAPGEHFFAVTIVDVNDMESTYSTVLSKTIN